MKYAYYPGCSLLASAVEYARSAEAVLRALGVELDEIEDWVCCGATPAHATSHLLSLALPAISCAAAEKKGQHVLTCCAACYSRLKLACREIKDNPELRGKVNEIIEEEFSGNVRVLHVAEVLAGEIALDAIAERVTKPLRGLKVACYYGCLMARLPDGLRIDNPEYPMMLDYLMRAAGAEAVEWPFKTECCGAALTLARPKTVVRLSGDIIRMAKENGADVIAVACPLCQANLDMYQSDAESKSGKQLGMPVLYFTQLLGLALGIELRQLCLDKLIVDPLPVLAGKRLIRGGVYL